MVGNHASLRPASITLPNSDDQRSFKLKNDPCLIVAPLFTGVDQNIIVTVIIAICQKYLGHLLINANPDIVLNLPS